MVAVLAQLGIFFTEQIKDAKMGSSISSQSYDLEDHEFICRYNYYLPHPHAKPSGPHKVMRNEKEKEKEVTMQKQNFPRVWGKKSNSLEPLDRRIEIHSFRQFQQAQSNSVFFSPVSTSIFSHQPTNNIFLSHHSSH